MRFDFSRINDIHDRTLFKYMRPIVVQCAALIASVLLIAGSGFAQGTSEFETLKTDATTPLISRQQSLALDGIVSPALSLNFGFVTDEKPVPNVFGDALTVTIQDIFGNTVIIGTIDANGVVWLPLTPGTLQVPSASLQTTPVPPPSLTPVLGQGTGHHALLMLPDEITGPTLNVFFDLFNNLNAEASLAWFSDLEIVPVPEPGVITLAPLGLLFVLIFRRKPL